MYNLLRTNNNDISTVLYYYVSLGYICVALEVILICVMSAGKDTSCVNNIWPLIHVTNVT